MSSLLIQHSSGVSRGILALLQQGADLAYGSGVVALEHVADDMLEVQERLASQRNDVVLFVLSDKDSLPSLHEGTFVARSEADIVGYFAFLGVELTIETSVETVPAPVPDVPVSAPQVSANYEFTLRQYQQQIAFLEQTLSEQSQGISASASSDASDDRVAALQSELDKARETISAQETLLNSKISETERGSSKITELIEQNLTLQKQVEELSATDHSSTELVRLRCQINQLESTPLFKLKQFMTPSSALQVALPYVPHPSHKGIRFIYAGSDGSMKLAYEVVRRLSGEMSTQGKVVILDLTTETYIDYILNIPRVVSASDWLLSGGDLPLSDTRVPNVKVLTPGLQYFNDLSLLNVNWSDRWNQLLQEGYQVIVLFGVLNTAITRVLYNSFGSINKPWIVVEGLITSLRSLIIHLSGLNAHPRVLMKRLNPNAQAFYQHLVETTDVTQIDSVDRLMSL